MKCPVCSIDLSMTDRQGVEIDYCPKCRGVWLDRGELDKLIERSNSPQSHGRPEKSDRDHHDDYQNHGEHQMPKERKRQGFLGRMLDFD
jgi:Zn-finger nucleic acid-binding protein